MFQFLKWCDWYYVKTYFKPRAGSFNSLNGAIDITKIDIKFNLEECFNSLNGAIDIGSKYIKNSGNTAFRRGLL